MTLFSLMFDEYLPTVRRLKGSLPEQFANIITDPSKIAWLQKHAITLNAAAPEFDNAQACSVIMDIITAPSKDCMRAAVVNTLLKRFKAAYMQCGLGGELPNTVTAKSTATLLNS